MCFGNQQIEAANRWTGLDLTSTDQAPGEFLVHVARDTFLRKRSLKATQSKGFSEIGTLDRDPLNRRRRWRSRSGFFIPFYGESAARHVQSQYDAAIWSTKFALIGNLSSAFISTADEPYQVAAQPVDKLSK